MHKVAIKDAVGETVATAQVTRSGKYVGLDFVVPGLEHGGFAAALDADELAQLVSALVTVQAEVITQNQ